MSFIRIRNLSAWASLLVCSAAVAAPPAVTPPRSVQVQLGQPASFSVAAIGAAPFTYHWYHWDIHGNASAIDRCGTVATCSIAAVTMADAGEYNVEVYDVNGEHAHGDPRASLSIIQGNEITAASCSHADVQAAVNQIPAGGSGTVLIPEGTCDWVTALLVIDDKASIWIKGAGRDHTTLLRTAADDGDSVLSDNNPAAIITFDCLQGQQVELSDIHLKGRSDNPDILTRGLELRGQCKNFKIHDAKFSKFSYAGVLVKGMHSKGVIYNNDFADNWKNGLGYGVAVAGWNSNINLAYWPPLEFGSENAVFIEDNYFSGQRHNVASGQGSRYVFRHNEMVAWRTNSDRDPSRRETFQDGQVDAHGVLPTANVTWDQQTASGSRSWEIYDNLFTMANDTFIPLGGGPGESPVASAGMRGGNGVFFCNRFDRAAHGGTLLFVEPRVSFEGNSQCHLFVDDYPAPFQVGFQGKSFFWDNTGDIMNGGNATRSTYMDDGTCNDLIKEDRDYFNMSPAEQGGEFANYTPYPYPHPLRDAVIFQDGFEQQGSSNPPLSCDAGRNGRPTRAAHEQPAS
ncbi:MAG: immunoglobulin domain-containing protein [Xanthomonadales bacterium]|nr:immunoglobulin domain-containing protein [Xanthomonadales bacterium]